MNNTTEIGAALAKLQESLKEIDSAREQVEKIVGAYGQTGVHIYEYIEELSNIHSKIVDLINLDKENLKKAEQSVLNISSQCDTIVKNLIASVEEILQQNREHIDVLQQKYGENLSANNDMFGKVAKSIVEDSRSSIAALKELVTDLSTIKSDISSAIKPVNTTIAKIDKLSNDFQQEANKRLESHNQTIELLKELAENQEKIKSDVISVMKPINTTIANLSNDFTQEANKRLESHNQTVKLLKELAEDQKKRDGGNWELLISQQKNSKIAATIIITILCAIAALILTK